MSWVSVRVARVKNIIPLLLLLFCSVVSGGEIKNQLVEANPHYSITVTVVTKFEHWFRRSEDFYSVELKELRVYRSNTGYIEKVEFKNLPVSKMTWWNAISERLKSDKYSSNGEDEYCYSDYIIDIFGFIYGSKPNEVEDAMYDEYVKNYDTELVTLKPEEVGSGILNMLIADFLNKYEVEIDDRFLKYFDMNKTVSQPNSIYLVHRATRNIIDLTK